MTDHTITQPTVETKPKWGDAWILRRDLRLDRAMVALAPAVSAATFVREYGSMIVENVSASREPLADLRHHYVRALNAATGEALFVGVITAETDDPHGPDVSPSGDQRLAATGLECFLTSAPVDHAYVHVDDKVVRTDRRMTFNAIAVSGRGLVGNRSKAKHGGTYVFSRDGDLWTAADVAEYLLARFAPPELAFELSGAIGSLAARVEAFDAARTVYEGLCALADPRRGVAWGVTFPGGAGPKVELFSLFAQAVGGGEPNAAQAAINLDAAALAGTSEVRIRAESANRYKRVVVRGSPVVLCTSYRGDQDLEKAWTDGLEAEYAALDVGGDPEATEKARRAERYRDVYRALRIPKDRHTTTTVSVDDEGEITFGNGALTTLGKAFYGRIPLVVGHDYSAGELPANAPAGAPLVEYRKPLVVVSTPRGAEWMCEAVDDPNEWADWPAPAAGVEILDGEPGFRLRVEPGYLWALGSWPATAAGAMAEPLRRWSALRITAAIAADARLAVSREIDGYDGEVDRTLIVEMPEAQGHVLLADTIIGVASDGAPIVAPRDIVLRNDADRLRAAADLAVAWYGKVRRAVSFTLPYLAGEADQLWPGVLITTLTRNARAFEINAIISSIEYAVGERGEIFATTVRTEFAELDPRAIVRARSAAPAGRAAGAAGSFSADGPPSMSLPPPSSGVRPGVIPAAFRPRRATVSADWDKATHGNSIAATAAHDDTIELTLRPSHPWGVGPPPTPAIDYVAAMEDDEFLYIPTGAETGIALGVRMGGIYTTPTELGPAEARAKSNEQEYGDEWVRGEDRDGAFCYVVTGISFGGSGEKRAYYRRLEWDSDGKIRAKRAEDRVTFDS